MKKVNENKGFTLAELLIVVAIIAVMVAIAIPTFGNRSEAAKEGVDASNLRSAYAIASTDLLAGTYKDQTATKKYLETKTTDKATVYTAYFNVTTGDVQYNKDTATATASAPATTRIAAYGKSAIKGLQGNPPDLPDAVRWGKVVTALTLSATSPEAAAIAEADVYDVTTGKIIKVTITPDSTTNPILVEWDAAATD